MAGPYFIPDLSSWQGDLPNFDAIAAQSDMVGCIIKSSQGLGPGVSPGRRSTWFQENWPRVAAAGGARYGVSFFRGLYHYATPTSSGTAQADHVVETVERAGGWAFGDLPPAFDLEGKLWTSRQQIVDVSSQFAERITRLLGRPPILYTGSIWRKFGVRERAKFGALWTPHLDLMAPYGWPPESVVLHQYVGDGKYWNPSGRPAELGYPTGVPGIGPGVKVDMSVVLDGGVPARSIERVRAILTGSAGPLARAGRGSEALSAPAAIGVGVGLLALGIIAASIGRDEVA